MKFVSQLCGHVPVRDAKLRTSHPDFWVAGDAAGIEEASAAMIEGRIAGLVMSEALGLKIQQENYGIYQERLILSVGRRRKDQMWSWNGADHRLG